MGVVMKFLILLLLLSTQAFAKPVPSQKRLPNENYEQAVKRYYMQLQLAEEQPQPDDVYSTSIPLKDVDDKFKERLPEFASLDLFKEAFTWSRDLRFMDDPDFENFPRRISWLYPDDGCFARAQVAQKKIREQFEGSQLGKVFAFGNLNVKTKNSPDGEVSWWYHVVPAARIENEVWVLDAAIDPKKPLTLEQWIAHMTPTQKRNKKQPQPEPQPQRLFVNFCKDETYSPSDSCLKPDEMTLESAINSQAGYLIAERERLNDLERNPDEELGDNPPWTKQKKKRPDTPRPQQYTPQYLMQ